MKFSRSTKAFGTAIVAAAIAFTGAPAASADSVSDILGNINTNSLPAIPALPPVNTDSVPSIPPIPGLPAPVLSIEQKRDKIEADLMYAINDMRRNHGLPNIPWDTRLAGGSRAWSENMTYNGFRHASSQERGNTGENIRFTTEDYSVVGRNAVASWLTSPGHRAILLDPRAKAYGAGAAWNGSQNGWMITYRMTI